MDRYLINVDQLEACYLRDDVVVIDSRYSLADNHQGLVLYQQSHIPGAHYLHLDGDLFRAHLNNGKRSLASRQIQD